MIEDKIKKIKMMVFDVDGVLTNGQIIIGPDGEACKIFYCQDGLGITAGHKAGIQTAIITGRESTIVKIRSQELKISHVMQGIMDKLEALESILVKYHLEPDEVGYMGDDLNDLAIMHRVGMAFAPQNAVSEVKAAADYVAEKQGGSGAVREVMELILKVQGKWEAVVDLYASPGSVETHQ